MTLLACPYFAFGESMDDESAFLEFATRWMVYGECVSRVHVAAPYSTP